MDLNPVVAFLIFFCLPFLTDFSLSVHLFLSSSCFLASLLLIAVVSPWRWCVSSLSMLNSSKSLLLTLASLHTQRLLSLSWQHSRCLIVLSFWSCLMLYFFLLIHSWKKKIKEKKSSWSQCFGCLEKWVEADNSLHWWREGVCPGFRVVAGYCRQHLVYFWPLGPSLSSWKVKESEVVELCLTLCDPMDCSLPGSSVHGIFQAGVVEWGAITFSRRPARPRDWTRVSCIIGRHFPVWASREVQVSSWLLCRMDTVSEETWPLAGRAAQSRPAPAAGFYLPG